MDIPAAGDTMNGVYCQQGIWVQYGGDTVIATLEDLWNAYLDGTLNQYQAWCVDVEKYLLPKEQLKGVDLCYTQPIPYVRNYHTQPVVTLLSEDGMHATVSADGNMVDSSEFAPVVSNHLVTNTPGNCRAFVAALDDDIGSKPGNIKYVRRIITYAEGFGCVMTIPVPNMICDSGYIVIA